MFLSGQAEPNQEIYFRPGGILGIHTHAFGAMGASRFYSIYHHAHDIVSALGAVEFASDHLVRCGNRQIEMLDGGDKLESLFNIIGDCSYPTT